MLQLTNCLVQYELGFPLRQSWQITMLWRWGQADYGTFLVFNIFTYLKRLFSIARQHLLLMIC
jgi:hypothetical protein